MKTWVAVVLGLLGMVAASCGPQPKPGERECWAKSRLGCTQCVLDGCGWCANGCYSFEEGGGCPEQIGFVGDCPDFAWPRPIPYRTMRRDGGAADAPGDR
jgi:hypothetical protein